jgi:hypothetical protein
MNQQGPFDELLSRMEKSLDQAKADPQVFLDDRGSMEQFTADAEELYLSISNLNSRLVLLFVDQHLMADRLTTALVNSGGLVDDASFYTSFFKLFTMLNHAPKAGTADQGGSVSVETGA